MKNKYNEDVKIIYDDKVKIEIIKSYSNTTDYMIQNNDEQVYLLEGSAKIIINNEEILLKKRDGLFIPKNTLHKVSYTSQDCEWLCIHFV